MSMRCVAVVAMCLALAESPQAEPCPPAVDAGLAAAAAAVAHDEVDAALARLEALAAPGCREWAVAVASLRGWRVARTAGATGGTAEALAGATAAREALAALGPAVSEAAYAHALVTAAVAAAQDEREDLQVWLDHAHDLARRLSAGRDQPRWPLPVDAAEGELWFDVDDFELSEAAFARALAAPAPGQALWRGLARARDRRGNREGACAAYRRTLDVATPGSALAAEARGYVLVCAR